MTQPDTARTLLRDAERYLSALHGSVARHDNLAVNLGCAGCELRDRLAAELRAEPSSAGVSPATDQTALRDRIAEALYPTYGQQDRNRSLAIADAVLSVLPASVDRADVYRLAADAVRDTIAPANWPADAISIWNAATNIAEHRLRRVAAETRNTTDQTGRLERGREQLIEAMSAVSEDRTCCGWASDWARTLHAEGGIWETLGRAVGWPVGNYDQWVWVSWDEAAALYATPPAGGAPQPKEADGDRVVAYRSALPGAMSIYCTRHTDGLGDGVTPLTSDDLPDGGVCAACHVDVLIPQPKEA